MKNTLITLVVILGISFPYVASADEATSRIITGTDPLGASTTGIGLATKPIRESTFKRPQQQQSGQPSKGAEPVPGQYYKEPVKQGGGYYEGGAVVDGRYSSPSLTQQAPPQH